MAITFVGSNIQDTGAGNALAFTIPAAAQAGDFMIAFVKQSENTTGREWDDDGGGGNGWTRLAYNRTTGGRDQETAIYWKVHSGSESNPVFTWNLVVTPEPMSGSLLVYRGTDTITPIQDWGFAEAQNDSSPPNPSVTLTANPATVLAFHAATHDDISSPAAPTGYTMRTQVWAGTANDHRNHFCADLIGLGSIGSYTPPDWQHSVLNNTPEYHTYTIALQEPLLIGVSDVDGDEQLGVGQQNVVLTGFGFEAVQGTGKLELWSDTSGTTKVVQTIDSWSDNSIQFDVVDTGLSEGTLYVVVTNDNGDESTPFGIVYGLPAYKDVVGNLLPDHYWTLDNTYNDTGNTGPTRNMTSGVVGGGALITSPIAEDTTHCWHQNGVLVRREIQDSPNMNITISSQERTVCTWVQLNGIQQSLGAIWKEGGGVQNLAFLVGIGNVLMAQLADVAGSRDNVQAISDFRLKAGRPYHILMRYSHTDNPAEFRLYIDGRKQEVTDGNPMVLGIFDSHSGDVTWGDPDNNLETGGTDIAYAGQEDTYLSHFATWSDNSANSSSGGLTDTEILRLFQRGAIPTDIISSGTESAMQSALDATSDSREDAPLSYRFLAPTGGGDLNLTMTDKVFDDGITEQIEWRGLGTLNITSVGSTNIDTNKIFASNGGTVNIIRPGVLTLNGLQNNSEVRVYEAGTETEVAGQENVTTGVFSATIPVNSVDIMIVSLDYQIVRLEAVDTSQDISLPIQQRLDRQYTNP